MLYDGSPEDGNVAEQLWHDWSFPLHTGDFAGTPGRLAWFIVALTPLALVVTGVVMWWVRRKRVNAIASRHPEAAGVP